MHVLSLSKDTKGTKTTTTSSLFILCFVCFFVFTTVFVDQCEGQALLRKNRFKRHQPVTNSAGVLQPSKPSGSIDDKNTPQQHQDRISLDYTTGEGNDDADQSGHISLSSSPSSSGNDFSPPITNGNGAGSIGYGTTNTDSTTTTETTSEGCPKGMIRDMCGTCGGNNEACTDCNGDLFGTAHMDCGSCIGGKTGIPDRSRKDCFGDCFGSGRRDAHMTCCYPQQKDQCGICYGKDKCLDCNNVVNGTAKYDDCGTCSGGNTGIMPNSDKDCDGVCFGSARIDDCNVCAGGETGRSPNVNKDCEGVCFGPAKVDVCGVCNGDGSTCSGCDGLPNSESVTDFCGVCKGDNSTCCGPFGNCNNRGVCARTNGGECSCDLGWTGKYCTQRSDMCRWQNCGSHGYCSPINGECICDTGFMGDHCEFSTCSFHGVTDLDHNGICNCFPGYTGPDCSYCAKPSIEGTEYVCITNYNEDINNMKIDKDRTRYLGYAVPKPISFSLFALRRDKVARALIGDHPMTIKEGKLAILPGTAINGTVYGCDCKPAVPYEDSFDVAPPPLLVPIPTKTDDIDDSKAMEKKDEAENDQDVEQQKQDDNGGDGSVDADEQEKIIKEVDAVELKKILSTMPRERLDKYNKYIKVYQRFKSGLYGRNHNEYLTHQSSQLRYSNDLSTSSTSRFSSKNKNMDRALTANEANTFLNELFAFFNEEANAFTDTPETVGQAVDSIQDSVESELAATLIYFSIVVTLGLLLITVAIISIVFTTGGDFLNLRALRAGGGAYGAGGYGAGGYGAGGYEGGY